MNLYDSILFQDSVIYKKVKARNNDDSRLYFLLYLYCAFLDLPWLLFAFMVLCYIYYLWSNFICFFFTAVMFYLFPVSSSPLVWKFIFGFSHFEINLRPFCVLRLVRNRVFYHFQLLQTLRLVQSYQFLLQPSMIGRWFYLFQTALCRWLLR